jgi:hypothetical protein
MQMLIGGVALAGYAQLSLELLYKQQQHRTHCSSAQVN